MSVTVECPINPTGPIPLGTPAADSRPAAVLMDGTAGQRRELVGIGRLNASAAGLSITVEVDRSTAQAIRFGSVGIVGIDADGGEMSAGGVLNGWRLGGAIIAHRCVRAAVTDTEWQSIPFGDRERPWDEAEADARVSASCGIDSDAPDWDCYASAHLYRDEAANPETKGAYKLLLVDVVDGRREVIPRAVFAAAGALQGARGGIDAPAGAVEAMREVLGDLYERMADQWDDESVRPPWETDE